MNSNFTKQLYLDRVIKYEYDRVNLTRLRISAHRLEIELGRYRQTPQEERFCPWCKIVLGTNAIEDESHFLQHCDLNATHRRTVYHKIKSTLTNAMSINTTTTVPSSTLSPHNISLNTNYLKLISNNSEILTSVTNESQVHLTRIIAAYAATCIKNRNKFTDSLSKK